jgi:ribosomal-protein-serine acetyltransferase
MTLDYRSLILEAGTHFRLVPLDLSFDETLFELIDLSRTELALWFPWCTADYDLLETRRWLQSRERARSEGRCFDFAVTRTTDGELVGAGGIDRIQTPHRVGNLYFWTGTPYLRQGAATASVTSLVEFSMHRLGLVRLEILVPERHRAAERVVEKVGASREVLLRNRFILQGELQHAYLFSVLGPLQNPLPTQNSRWEKVA